MDPLHDHLARARASLWRRWDRSLCEMDFDLMLGIGAWCGCLRLPRQVLHLPGALDALCVVLYHHALGACVIVYTVAHVDDPQALGGSSRPQ